MRRKKKIKIGRLLLSLLIIALILVGAFFARKAIINRVDINIDKFFPAKYFAGKDEHGWELTLVNFEHRISNKHEFQPLVLANGQAVDERIYPALQSMFDEMRNEEIYPTVISGFRDEDTQRDILSERIRKYWGEGLLLPHAEEKAQREVALPGFSEHHLGLALDIGANPNLSTDGEVYSWLANHAHEYGFILRYPENKEDITGIIYEPWHYRYVGEEHAKNIYEKQVTLEEYLDLI